MFYKDFEPEVKHNTVNWRVHTLVQFGVLSRIGKGKFVIGKSRNFMPELSTKNRFLYKELHKQFPYIEKCIWSTSVLNEFMLHQPGKYYTLIEVEKDVTESVFNFLSENNKNIFLEPTADILSLYASKEKNDIIIKSLVSEAPIQLMNGVNTATLEKVLVDVFCEEVLFAAQQGSEMQTIFLNAFENYTLNENKMLRYADRRRRKDAFVNYLKRNQFSSKKLELPVYLL